MGRRIDLTSWAPEILQNDLIGRLSLDLEGGGGRGGGGGGDRCL
jgi:hypothetical protein